jgi:hypothetical protein
VCEADAVVCIRCGTNLKTGMPMQPVAEMDVEGELTAGERVLMWFGDWFPGLLRPLILLAALVTAVAGFFVIGLSLFILSLGGAISAFAIGAAGLVLWAQAVGWVMFGEWALLSEILAEFDGRRWTVFIVIVMLPITAAFAAANLLTEKEKGRAMLRATPAAHARRLEPEGEAARGAGLIGGAGTAILSSRGGAGNAPVSSGFERIQQTAERVEQT